MISNFTYGLGGHSKWNTLNLKTPRNTKIHIYLCSCGYFLTRDDATSVFVPCPLDFKTNLTSFQYDF